MPGTTLLLITNHFPYGKGETFVDNEVPFLVKAFDKVVVLAREKDPTITRDVTGITHHRVNPQSTFSKKLRTFLSILFRLRTFLRIYKEEKRYIRQRNITFTPAIRKQILHDLVKAFDIALVIESVIKKENISGKLILYSYWLNAAALAITLVRNPHTSIRTIARGHGGDIHEFRHATKFIPFRNVLAKRLNRIIISATAGREHFIRFIDENLQPKVLVSHLGTVSFGQSPAHPTEEKLLIFTCSNIIEVKRLHLVVEALAQINDLPIHWVHIGEGHLRTSILELARLKLDPKPNIQYDFLGQKKYEEVMDFYRNHYIDLFLNTSSSEATPVSIMEANSFGVPAIGFDVGGVGDIVNDHTGRLLASGDGSAELAKAIHALLSASHTEREKLRHSTKDNWQKKYHADIAYQRFVGMLQALESN